MLAKSEQRGRKMEIFTYDAKQRLKEFFRCKDVQMKKMRHNDTRAKDKDGFLIIDTLSRFDTAQDLEIKTRGQNIVYS